MFTFLNSLMSIPLDYAFIVFGAGFVASVLNSFAGGGMFLAFPVLLGVGIPPIIANATCKTALIFGNAASVWAYRRYFTQSKAVILSMLVLSLLGGGAGALLTLYLGQEGFQFCIPWLILGATMIAWRGSNLTNMLQKNAKSYIQFFAGLFNHVLLLLTALYGGFFGAGIGVLLIATINLRGITDINAINAVKNVMSVLINVVAIVVYCIWGVVNWPYALVQMLGTIVGGYAGGRVGLSLNQQTVRNLITLIGLCLTVVYFYKYGYFSFLILGDTQ